MPRPDRIREFPSRAAFESWLAGHHDSEEELWLAIHKKGSGLPTVTYAEAVDVALCWGWIDGLKKSLDEQTFLQRFTPRRAKSVWSQINRDHVARLVAEGRMTPHGMRHVEAARADGRWEAAYASQRGMTMPADLLAAIDAAPNARAAFDALPKASRFAFAFRLGRLRTDSGRRKGIAEIVARLARGEAPHLAQRSDTAKAQPTQAAETRPRARSRQKKSR